MASKAPVTQSGSKLLSGEENDQIFRLLGFRCQTLATTVVQLFDTNDPQSTEWFKRDVGVLCFVRDANKRSFYFRLYCLESDSMVWEHEIYNSMEYLAPRSFLHTFESEERIIAFNFADEDEAAYLREKVLEKLKVKTRKPKLNIQENEPIPNINITSSSSQDFESKTGKKLKKKEKKKKKGSPISRLEISVPINFRHVSHVGFEKDTGFKMDNVDDTLKKFFEKAGVTNTDLENEERRAIIYDFIEKNGVYDVMQQNIYESIPERSPSPLPPRSVTSRPSANTSAQSASPMSPPLQTASPTPLGSLQRIAVPAPPLRAASPTPPSFLHQRSASPVPPPRTVSPTAPLFKHGGNMRFLPPPPPPGSPPSNAKHGGNMHFLPPPPPPGPPPSDALTQKKTGATIKLASPPPPPPPPFDVSVEEPPATSGQSTVHSNSIRDPSKKPIETDMKNANGGDPMNNLFSQIQQGIKLKPVAVETRTKKPNEGDSRGELLDEIRKHKQSKLKPVSKVDKPAKPSDGDNLARDLHDLLEKIRVDKELSSGDSDDSDHDNEWDD